MAFRRPRDGEPTTEKWLEVDASMTGTLAFKDSVNLQINGRFEGTLNTKGRLSIGENAQVQAAIQGEAVRIAGTVTGDVIASNRVELLATARVAGKVRAPVVVMQEGALFNGTLDMPRGAQDGDWMGVEELARFLEVDAATVSQWAQAGKLPAQREGEGWRFQRVRIEEWLAQEKIK